MQLFTQEDLLRYVYGETTPEITTAITEAIQNDWQLKEEYQQLMLVKSQLDTLRLSPSRRTIDAIMDYAQKAVETEISAG
jgi:hypothetical protein